MWILFVNDLGFLKIKGRQDDMIIKSGMNIYPSEIENIINESGISPARSAALRLKAQQVKRLAGQVAVITENNHKSSQQVLKECRIISINKELGIVAIEAGAHHGVFKGMVFHTLPGNPPAELKITITRPDISGAAVTKGDINQLGSGMRISAIESRGTTP